MFIVYRKGQIVNQITAWGSAREPKLGGRFSVATFTQPRLSYRATISELEALLIACGAIIPSEKKPPAGSSDDIDEESEEEVSQVGSKSTWANFSSKNVRNTSKKDDSDSDFDL